MTLVTLADLLGGPIFPPYRFISIIRTKIKDFKEEMNALLCCVVR